jgi:hypothetical protein
MKAYQRLKYNEDFKLFTQDYLIDHKLFIMDRLYELNNPAIQQQILSKPYFQDYIEELDRLYEETKIKGMIR